MKSVKAFTQNSASAPIFQYMLLEKCVVNIQGDVTKVVEEDIK